MNTAAKMNTTYISTPKAATPFCPASRSSWKLYSMPTTEAVTLLTSSDAPLPLACKIGRSSSFVFVSCSRLLLGRRKYTSGSTPPTIWLMPVAMAAPATPQWNTAMNRASSAMLVTPAATVKAKPRWGFSAVTKKLWNIFCKMKKGRQIIRRRP